MKTIVQRQRMYPENREAIGCDISATSSQAQIVRKRSLSEIKRIVVHQGDYPFGINGPAQTRMKAHYCVMDDGSPVMVHNPIMYHNRNSHSFNRSCVSIEMTGMWFGKVGLKRSFVSDIHVGDLIYHREPYRMTPYLKEGLKMTLVHLHWELGIEFGALLANTHAQSHPSRLFDCGEEVYRAYEDICVELGIPMDYATAVGGGAPIGSEWSQYSKLPARF